MAGEPTQIKFSYQDLATMMVKERGINEGYWSVYAKFALNAVNISLNNAPAVPCAIVPMVEFGLQREPDEGFGELAVNASEVNPLYKQAGKGAKKAGSKKKAVKK